MTPVAIRSSRRPLLAAVCLLVLLLSGCTGRGGGQLPPQLGFTGSASFGFSFSCEDKGGLNPQTGQLRIQLSYADRGEQPLGSSFSVHGTADTVDPVVESMFCIGQNPPPGGGELIFLGQYRFTSSTPPDLSGCAATATTAPACRFEVIVRDDDGNRAPSTGDFFSIKLSNAGALASELDPETVVYARAGVLSSGNLTVDERPAPTD